MIRDIFERGFKTMVLLEIEPRGLIRLFHLEHRDAVDWLIVDAGNQFVIKHFVPSRFSTAVRRAALYC